MQCISRVLFGTDLDIKLSMTKKRLHDFISNTSTLHRPHPESISHIPNLCPFVHGISIFIMQPTSTHQ